MGIQLSTAWGLCRCRLPGDSQRVVNGWVCAVRMRVGRDEWNEWLMIIGLPQCLFTIVDATADVDDNSTVKV